MSRHSLASVSHLCGIVLSCLLGDYSHKQVIHCLPRACHLGTALAQAMKAGDGRLAKKIGDGRLSARAGEEGWRGPRVAGKQSLWRGGLVRNAGEESWRGWLAKTGWKAGGEGRRGMLAQKGWRRGLARKAAFMAQAQHRQALSALGQLHHWGTSFSRTAFFSAPPPTSSRTRNRFFLGVRKGKVFFLALSFEPSGCVGSAPV